MDTREICPCLFVLIFIYLFFFFDAAGEFALVAITSEYLPSTHLKDKKKIRNKKFGCDK